MREIMLDVVTVCIVLVALAWGLVVFTAPIWIPAALLVWWLA